MNPQHSPCHSWRAIQSAPNAPWVGCGRGRTSTLFRGRLSPILSPSGQTQLPRLPAGRQQRAWFYFLSLASARHSPSERGGHAGVKGAPGLGAEPTGRSTLILVALRHLATGPHATKCGHRAPRYQMWFAATKTRDLNTIEIRYYITGPRKRRLFTWTGSRLRVSRIPD